MQPSRVRLGEALAAACVLAAGACVSACGKKDADAARVKELDLELAQQQASRARAEVERLNAALAQKGNAADIDTTAYLGTDDVRVASRAETAAAIADNAANGPTLAELANAKDPLSVAARAPAPRVGPAATATVVISWQGVLEDGASAQWTLPPTGQRPFEKYSLQLDANSDGATVSWPPCTGAPKQTRTHTAECSPYDPITLTVKNPGRGFGSSVGVALTVRRGPAF